MLGPLEVRTDSGERAEIGGARLRRLLTLLALHPGQVVTVPALVEAVWDGEPPARTGNALQALVSRLRRASAEVVVEPPPAR
jgi:DNA-binding SARP family transcriptional activator